ncbi:FecR family protein [Pedobacter kyonggii]|uniref:FecR family protein n=1 Tax=Pedobacter kyonggii TaxID=1926871 RepID=A0A4Q9HFR1_9SPHI|nr:FecR family protein [Pedobacter kyonggii]TBO43683.1 FecR family protein [Pedobacter kyonggii]
MTEVQAKELLQKYLNKQASPQEQKKVEAWYAKLNQENIELAADRKVAIGEQMLVHLQAAMRQNPKHGKVFKLQPFIRIAAAVLIIITLGIGIWKLNTPMKLENQVTVVTGSTERKNITLSDGSVVLLSPSSKLCYPKAFASNNRQIALTEGEAFFEIAHQEKRPFMVHTASGVDIRVLGTSFKVKSYQASKHVEVAVITGKVAVSKKNVNLGMLIKDEFLIYDKTVGRADIGKTKAMAFIELAFDGASLDQIINKLQYVYSIKISLSDSALSKLKSTAVFNSRQSPEEILDIICSLHHLKFNASKNHKTFNIYR